MARTRWQRFSKQHPTCCFCGGGAPAAEIDHIPSIQMFAQRQRPKGLESPACTACNRTTRLDEQVAAMLARSWPPLTTDVEKDEIRGIMQAVANNNPALMHELMTLDRQYNDLIQAGLNPSEHSCFNASGPLVNRSIKRFAYKLICSLYYAKTGLIVPAGGGVFVSWYTNFNKLKGEIPDAMFQLLGPPETLQQGKMHVGDQFEYAWAIADTKKVGQFFAGFRRSFCINGFVHYNISFLEKARPDADLFRPEAWRDI
jgi:hypothetical protein